MPTKIEWTDETWNPVTGCTPVSMGCDNCYARRMAKRLKAMGQKKYEHGFIPHFHADELDRPEHWRKPRMVFVGSMGDLMHGAFSSEQIQEVIDTMAAYSNHTYQVLTKRASRLEDFNWPENVWVGVTIEHQDYVGRARDLLAANATVKFVSLEPLLGPVHFNSAHLGAMDWVVVGGETGPGARPFNLMWLWKLQEACHGAGVPLFVKQFGDNPVDADKVVVPLNWKETWRKWPKGSQ